MSRVLSVKHIPGGKPGKVYYPLELKTVPKPEPGPGQLLVKLTAAALNHRDLFIRHHLYPAISFSAPLLADGHGVVVDAGPSVQRKNLLNQRVILTPMRGWDSDPISPEGPFATVGGTTLTDVGMAQDYVVVDEDEVVPAPDHLSHVEAAALPLVGLTGWRALVTKAGCDSPGKNVLITGIGGGVALQVLQFAVAFGCNVFVTSGSQDKIDKAKTMGAAGGVNYKEKGWEAGLQALLPEDRPYLDAVVDGAGGPIIASSVKLLRQGGVVAQYGMTVAPKMDWVMKAVLLNVELKGTTMGSKKEFKDMVAFVNKHKIKPVVFKTVTGLDNTAAIEELFDVMAQGSQFGKLVIEIDGNANGSKL